MAMVGRGRRRAWFAGGALRGEAGSSATLNAPCCRSRGWRCGPRDRAAQARNCGRYKGTDESDGGFSEAAALGRAARGRKQRGGEDDRDGDDDEVTHRREELRVVLRLLDGHRGAERDAVVVDDEDALHASVTLDPLEGLFHFRRLRNGQAMEHAGPTHWGTGEDQGGDAWMWA